MTRVSSNTTLFWKMFVPILYTTFFGMLGIAILFELGAKFSLFTLWYVKISYWMIFLSFIGFMYFTILTIKRVEMDGESFIATNYFKTFKYSFEDIESYKKYNFGLFKLNTIYLKSKGKFGKKIRFIPYQVGIQSITENHKHWRALINDK